MNRSWLGPSLLLVLAAILGVVLPASSPPPGGAPADTGDTAWMLTASGLVLLMTPGLAFFYGGMVRPKNVLSTMLQSFIAMGTVTLIWVAVGFSLAFGDSLGPEAIGLVGDPRTFFFLRGVGVETHPELSPTIPFVLFAIFQMKFAIITPALVTGSLAERVRFSAWLVFLSLFTILVYAPVAHWTWHPNGFLRQLGVLDFAGGTVVHLLAGFAALAGVLALGPRKDFQPGTPAQPANIPFVLLGTGMLWFGWFGFNAGSALAANGIAAQAFLTTSTASAAAMLGWLFLDGLAGRRPTVLGACIGAVVGLVAITPAAGYVTVGAALAIGTVAAVVSNVAVYWKTRTEVDDTLDVFPCHGVGGAVGMLATGLFATRLVNPDITGGVVDGNWGLLARHVLALLIVATWALGGAWLLFKVTARIVPLRVTAEDEQAGLDLSQHGESVHRAA